MMPGDQQIYSPTLCASHAKAAKRPTATKLKNVAAFSQMSRGMRLQGSLLFCKNFEILMLSFSAVAVMDSKWQTKTFMLRLTSINAIHKAFFNYLSHIKDSNIYFFSEFYEKFASFSLQIWVFTSLMRTQNTEKMM